AELQTLETYHVSEKSIYSTASLIEHAEHIFPPAFRERLPALALTEFNQSGRCLAFDNFTAAGFHAMRAVEAVMDAFYLAACKPVPKPTERLPNWGAYIAELKKLETDTEVLRAVSILQQLKDHD